MKPRRQQHSRRMMLSPLEPKKQEKFERLERILGKPLGPGRARILKIARLQGFELSQLAFAFKQYGGGLNQVGGLIRFAEAWSSNSAQIESWPCMECFDEGTVDAPESPYDGKLPCECEVGKKREKGFPWIDEYRRVCAEGGNFCGACGNTGMLRPDDCDYTGPCSCEKGHKVSKERRRIAEETKGIRQSFIDQGKCPDCSGTGRRNRDGVLTVEEPESISHARKWSDWAGAVIVGIPANLWKDTAVLCAGNEQRGWSWDWSLFDESDRKGNESPAAGFTISQSGPSA